MKPSAELILEARVGPIAVIIGSLSFDHIIKDNIVFIIRDWVNHLFIG